MAKRPKRNGRTRGSVGIPAPHAESESVRIRKITNGYVITRSGMKRGKYVEHEEYSAGRPIITAQVAKPARAPARQRGHQPAQRRGLIG